MRKRFGSDVLCCAEVGPVRAWVARLVVSACLPLLAAGSVAPAHAQELDRFLEECTGTGAEEIHEDESRFSDECKPLAIVPERPRAILELGDPFLGTGTLGRGFTLPTGAVWQPSLLVYGTFLAAVQGREVQQTGAGFREIPARANLFANLFLTPTERVVIGIRPLDQNGAFTGYTLQARPIGSLPEEFKSELNATIRTLFFEGDLGEIFPNLDRDDSRGFDVYFSVGRQPLAFQDGLLINEDMVDMVGLTRANLKIGGLINTRVTGVFGWGGITRHSVLGNQNDDSAKMFGLFTEIDTRSSTFELDVLYVAGDAVSGKGIHGGIGVTGRIGRFNNTLRVLGSAPIGNVTEFNSSGVLIHEQFSWTPHGGINLAYITAYAGIGQFRSAARGPLVGGPLGRTGILWASAGLGRFGPPLGNQSDDSFGGAVGYQMFFDDTRKQLVLEAGARRHSKGVGMAGTDLVGIGGRYQIAMGRHWVLTFAAARTRDLIADLDVTAARAELLLKL